MIIAISCGVVEVSTPRVESKFIELPKPKALGQRRACVGGIQSMDFVLQSDFKRGAKGNCECVFLHSGETSHPPISRYVEFRLGGKLSESTDEW